MLKLISRIQEQLRERRAVKAIAEAKEQRLLAAIEQVVDQIEPRIRGISGYRRKMRPAVQRTLEFATEICDRIPGPIEVSRKTWSSDPMVKAFFAGTEDLRRVFSNSDDIREVFTSHPASEQMQCYAVLSMERREKTVLDHLGKKSSPSMKIKQSLLPSTWRGVTNFDPHLGNATEGFRFG